MGTNFRTPDYVKIAEGYGANATSVGTEAEYASVLNEALRSGTLTVIDARIDPSAYPTQFDAIREL